MTLDPKRHSSIITSQEPAPWKGAGLLAGVSLTLDQSQPPVSRRLTGLRSGRNQVRWDASPVPTATGVR